MCVTAESSALSNAAQGHWAWQSSTEWGGVATRASDGNQDIDINILRHCTHTGRREPPVWGVDLQAIRDVHYVEALNRAIGGGYTFHIIDILCKKLPRITDSSSRHEPEI